jgi:putative ABC transport system permease protein
LRSVTKAFLRYLPRRRSLSLLQIVGIACGVAAVVGMVFSARSAFVSFSRAVDFLNGNTTHFLERTAGPIEEAVLIDIMKDPAVEDFSPVIDRVIRLQSGEPIRLLAIDPFLDRSLRPDMSGVRDENRSGKEKNGLAYLSFLFDSHSCLMDEPTASRLGLQPGNAIRTSKGSFRILATFPSTSSEPLLVIDISHAQSLFRLPGKVDRIDLMLNDEKGFRSRLGQGFRIQSVRERNRLYSSMLDAFRLNLEALSLIALFVGIFLIYNTTMFSVISRRKDAGILRSLGAGRREILLAFFCEILLFGLSGGILGGVLGYLLTYLLTGLVGQTVSNLYFFLKPTPLPWSWWIVVVGAFFGCSASILGSLFPLLDLIHASPVATLQGRTVLKNSTTGLRRVTITGLAFLLLTLVLLALSSLHVYVGFAAAFALLFGSSLLAGLFVAVTALPMRWALGLVGGLPGRIAGGNLRKNLSRTSVATAAFMIALSMSVGLASMIGSFRQSLVWWMGTQLRADIYVGYAAEGTTIPEGLYNDLKAVDGIGGFDPYRNVQMPYRDTSITIVAVSAEVLQKYTSFGWLKGGNENWEPVKKGEIIISESFSRAFHVQSGQTVTLVGRKGPHRFRVAAVFYDYTTERGLVMMDRSTYLSVFGDPTINSLGIFIDSGNPEKERLLHKVRSMAASYGLPVYSLAGLRHRILSVFDSTFAVTRSMRILAIIVAFFGITGALLTLFIERQREFGIYRALGFSTKQVAVMTVMEGLGMGLISFLGSIVVGTILAVILIKVINLRSFNWTIFYYPSADPYLWTGIAAVLASITASIYPVFKIWRTYPHMQMREE